ncbi:RING-box protein hrt1 [Clarireedia jacksonii]
MADVDMTDAPPAVAKKGGSKKAAGGDGAEGKKRFEVKKVLLGNSNGMNCIFNGTTSGTLWLYGLGILSLITALSAEIILWISVLNARQIKLPPQVRNALLHGVSATLVKFARSTTETGNSRNMVARKLRIDYHVARHNEGWMMQEYYEQNAASKWEA